MNNTSDSFKKWTCIFPGKMGISWKLAWNSYGTKEEAEKEASKYCNSVAVPLQLWEHIHDCEHRLVEAESTLRVHARHLYL